MKITFDKPLSARTEHEVRKQLGIQKLADEVHEDQKLIMLNISRVTKLGDRVKELEEEKGIAQVTQSIFNLLVALGILVVILLKI